MNGSEAHGCGAHCRTTGNPCRQTRMANGRCKMHGGKSPIKHGMRTNKAVAERKQYAELMRESRELMKEVTE